MSLFVEHTAVVYGGHSTSTLAGTPTPIPGASCTRDVADVVGRSMWMAVRQITTIMPATSVFATSRPVAAVTRLSCTLASVSTVVCIGLMFRCPSRSPESQTKMNSRHDSIQSFSLSRHIYYTCENDGLNRVRPTLKIGFGSRFPDALMPEVCQGSGIRVHAQASRCIKQGGNDSSVTISPYMHAQFASTTFVVPQFTIATALSTRYRKA